MEGKLTEVNSSWTKFLKGVGKVKLFSSDPVVVTEPNFNGTVYPKGESSMQRFLMQEIFSRVWLGVLPKEWDERDGDMASKETEKLVYQFAVRYNREKVQKQIDETQQAVDAVEKQKQRLVNQNKEMALQLTNNEKGKNSSWRNQSRTINWNTKP